MPRLTEQEIQDIYRYIESDKPLPDKYRFLLFADKREVELVWNGKTNEVCNIVMPFQVIEQVDEPRAEKPTDTAMQLGLFDERLAAEEVQLMRQPVVNSHGWRVGEDLRQPGYSHGEGLLRRVKHPR